MEPFYDLPCLKREEPSKIRGGIVISLRKPVIVVKVHRMCRIEDCGLAKNRYYNDLKFCGPVSLGGGLLYD